MPQFPGGAHAENKLSIQTKFGSPPPPPPLQNQIVVPLLCVPKAQSITDKLSVAHCALRVAPFTTSLNLMINRIENICIVLKWVWHVVLFKEVLCEKLLIVSNNKIIAGDRNHGWTGNGCKFCKRTLVPVMVLMRFTKNFAYSPPLPPKNIYGNFMDPPSFH